MNGVRNGIVFSALIWLGAAAILTSLTGCAGIELGGKMGLYAVDTREEQQVTKSRAKPLRCLWSNCGEVVEASGS